MSFLICLVDKNDKRDDSTPIQQVPTHQQAVHNTVDRLIELYHPATFHNSQGYTFPQKSGQPEDIFNIQVAESCFLFTTDQLLHQMALQGVAEESWDDVVLGIVAREHVSYDSCVFFF